MPQNLLALSIDRVEQMSSDNKEGCNELVQVMYQLVMQARDGSANKQMGIHSLVPRNPETKAGKVVIVNLSLFAHLKYAFEKRLSRSLCCLSKIVESVLLSWPHLPM